MKPLRSCHFQPCYEYPFLRRFAFLFFTISLESAPVVKKIIQTDPHLRIIKAKTRMFIWQAEPATKFIRKQPIGKMAGR